MIFYNYDSARAFLSRGEFVDFDSSFSLSKLCSRLLRNPVSESHGRDLAIRMKDAVSKDRVEPSTVQIWNDILESSGLYPYLEPETLSDSALIRYEYSRSKYLEGVYLHEKQHELSLQLQERKTVIVSAPTSFGKSLLIEEVIASRIYRNIVIIQPTLALLDETRKKLLKYRSYYKLIISTKQAPHVDLGNIFLFTGERVVEYTEFNTVDFFVIDEFYKLSLDRDDDRAIALNQALKKLLGFTSRFYMLGPMINSIPVSVVEKFELIWDRNEFATVAVDEINMQFDSRFQSDRRKEKIEKLLGLITSISEPTLIYCSSPARCSEIITSTVEHLKFIGRQVPQNVPQENLEIIEWIEQNISKEWILNTALRYGIAFHHGALPRHVGSSIVDLFNNGSIKFLFCTATLIEGVNTSAKNVVFFDKKKGDKDVDFFDYKNIAGRSGRMRRHFIGNVFRFESEPEQLSLDVDIPVLTQNNAPIEILLSISEEELKPESKERLRAFNSLPKDKQAVIRLNSGIKVQGQLNIISEIEKNIQDYYPLLSWNQYPTFEQLALVIQLGWKHLAAPNDKSYVPQIGRLSARWLTQFVFTYIRSGSIGRTISQIANQDFWIEKIPDRDSRISIATFTILQISRHWFDYKLPKWLSVISGLQHHVLSGANLKPGNYAFLASSLEHGFLNPSLASLREYDIPITAIRKLVKVLDTEATPEQNILSINKMSDQALALRELLTYEIKKVRRALPE